MKKVTKYIAVRETEGAYGRTYRRYQECSSKKAGIAWFKGGDLGPCRTVSIYAVEFDEGEDLSTLQPCMKKRIPEVGTLVFKKYNDKIIFEELEQEAETEAKAEPAMNEWRVSTNYCGGERSYQVYRRIDANATDHSGNRENKGGVFGAKAEAQAYADKLNAGEDPEAPETKPEPKHEEEAIEEKSGSARYYVTWVVDKERHPKLIFFLKRKVFFNEEEAIAFARARILFGDLSARVYLYDPAMEKYPAAFYESADAHRDAVHIQTDLENTKLFSVDRNREYDLRENVHRYLTAIEKLSGKSHKKNVNTESCDDTPTAEDSTVVEAPKENETDADIPNCEDCKYFGEAEKGIGETHCDICQNSGESVKQATEQEALCKPTYYVVLKVASNRRRTKFHSKLKAFHDEEKAINYARSRVRGGCVNARVFLLDPEKTNHLPYEFAKENANTAAIRVMVFLGKWELFYCDRSTERDLRKAMATG